MRTCSSRSATFAAGMPIVLLVVLPVPIPMIARPGAKELIVAIPQADRGAIRDAGFVTPGPIFILLVLSAHKAILAYTSLPNI